MLELKEVPAALPSMVRAMIPIGSTLTRSEPNRAERGRGITDDSWQTWRRLGSSSFPPPTPPRRGVVQCGPDGGQGLLAFGIHRGRPAGRPAWWQGSVAMQATGLRAEPVAQVPDARGDRAPKLFLFLQLAHE